jgi:SulP family sulfate permease
VPDKKRQPAFVLDETVENSPRRHHLHQAALEATKGSSSAMAAVRRNAGIAEGGQASDRQASAPRTQPLALLLVTFSAYAGPDADEALFAELASYFRPMHAAEGETLWEQGDESDSLYLIEAGILNVRYDFEEGFELNERVLAGTLAGELTFLSCEPRNTTAHVELDCTLHRIDRASMKELEQKSPAVFGAFVQMLLRATAEEQSQLMSYLVSRLS